MDKLPGPNAMSDGLWSPTMKAAAMKDAAKVVELHAALSDLIEYAELASRELTDPGTGLLCAIHNAKAALKR